MKRECPHCHAILDFGDRPPSFCAFCGQSLKGVAFSSSVVADAAQVDANATTPLASEAATVAPASADPSCADSDPEVIGNYRLLRPLGQGGMGTVYEAEDVGSGRRVALKLVARGFAGSEDAVERFRQEGRLASALVHPRCVFVYAADEEGGRPYIVMELMPGKTLDDLVREKGPLGVTDAVETIMDVIDGLREAHQLGIIHRDVKPSNCFLEADGRVKVGDFGLAKSLVNNVRLTGTGSFLGTPLYASPEQVRAEKLTPQSDVYSVAATLYFLLAGKAPFESGDPVATLARIVTDDPPPVRGLRPEVPEMLDQVILRGLERRRERRYADLDEFRVALQPYLRGRSPFVGLGLRFGAYLIDFLVLLFFSTLVEFGGVLGFLFPAPNKSSTLPAIAQQLLMELLGILVYFLYFMPEWPFGSSLGKHLLGLRVIGTDSTAPPGWWRGMLRSGLFYVLLQGGSFIYALFVWVLTRESASEQTNILSAHLFWAGLISVLNYPLGIVLVCSTMRGHNGMRGLHDFATGTRVIRVSQIKRRKTLDVPKAPINVPRPGELPARIGPYRIKAALSWNTADGTLLAEDPGLDRDVLLWLRPCNWPTLDTHRRNLGRVTRLRWLAAGQYDANQWDAFLLPPGATLSELARARGPLDWQDVRSILEQLARELDYSCEEHTVPPCLGPEHVWIQANGRVVLLDAPAEPHRSTGIREKTDSTKETDLGSVEEQEQDSSLELLREAASLTVNGNLALIAEQQPRRQSPLPIYAIEILRRLGDEDAYANVAEFHQALRKSSSRPAEVTRLRRAGQLAVLAGFLFLGLCCCIIPAGFYPPLLLAGFQYDWVKNQKSEFDEFEQMMCCELATRTLQPNLWGRVAGSLQYEADRKELSRLRGPFKRDEAEAEARISRLNSFHGAIIQALESQRPASNTPGAATRGRSSFRRPRFYVHLSSKRDQEQMTKGAAFFVLIWPSLWVLWAFVARGGFSHRIAGLALVRRDGRPAGRFQCLWRALVVWLPVTTLFVGSIWLDYWYWITWQPGDPRDWMINLTKAMWWSGFVLLAGYVVFALRSPSRTLHDRLAGTFVVPR